MELNKLLGVVGALADIKNPKAEFNYILVDDGKLVVTDTRLLFIVDYELELPNHIDGQVLLDTGKSTGLKNDTIVVGRPATTEGKFPDYQRIRSNETRVVHSCDTVQEAIALYPHFAQSGNAYIDILRISTKLKKLEAITQNVEVIKLAYVNAPLTLKLTLLDDVKAELIVMPVSQKQSV